MKKFIKSIFLAVFTVTVIGCSSPSGAEISSGSGGSGEPEKLDYWYQFPVDAHTLLKATKDSEYIYFGVFPQTKKEDTVTVDENDKVEMGTDNFYYKGDDKNYYAKVGVDYYQVEPIMWRVLTNNYNNTGNALLLAEKILAGEVPFFDASNFTRNTNIYPNNYMHSQIRAYLNGISYMAFKEEDNDKWLGKGFLQLAFTKSAQSKIFDTCVINDGDSTSDAAGNLTKADGSSTGYKTNYTCDPTIDKIFLLSEQEVTTTEYGFAKYNEYKGDGTTIKSTRIKVTTDFASANKAHMSTEPGFGGWWWLRSPMCTDKSYCRNVLEGGKLETGSGCNTSEIGVVPALTIKLQ